MAKRSFIFRKGSEELILPVTPASFRVEKGINIEVVNIHELGDAILAGKGSLATIQISCLFPEMDYSFAEGSGASRYVSQFEEWIEAGEVVRFIIGGANVNLPVMVQSINWGEQDGTNDVYADITMREHRPLEAVQISATPAATLERAAHQPNPGESSYTIQSGDTLSAICRKYYGDASPASYNKLAQANGISNPHLIFAGKTLKIPQPLQ
ncbi:LysM domain-containing protein [Oscillospiraceae bacterium MB08-C2-2]|nr:LysM domain-containing protein [Oscillospiraceae bacterium MB08-C2-2]